MGIMDKIKGIVNPEDGDEGHDDVYVFGDENEAANNNGAPVSGYNGGTNYDNMNAAATDSGYTVPQRQGGQQDNYGGVALNGAALELKLIKPKQWEHVNQIADNLINKRTVVLNLEDTNKETARRMIDFLLGVVYTIEGDIKMVAANTWVITPSNVDLSQDSQLGRPAQPQNPPQQQASNPFNY